MHLKLSVHACLHALQLRPSVFLCLTHSQASLPSFSLEAGDLLIHFCLPHRDSPLSCGSSVNRKNLLNTHKCMMVCVSVGTKATMSLFLNGNDIQVQNTFPETVNLESTSSIFCDVTVIFLRFIKIHHHMGEGIL